MERINSSPNSREHKFQLEEGKEILLDFYKIKKVSAFSEMIPVIVQHAITKEVLMLAYVNPEALQKSLELKKAVFFSTSRNEIWYKGNTSGNYLELKEVRVNCEQNSLLFLVIPVNQGVCHTYKNSQKKHRETCFYRKIINGHLEFIKKYF